MKEKESRNPMSHSIMIPWHEINKEGTGAMRWAGAVVVLLALVCFSTPAARGQCQLQNADTWFASQSGLWSNGNNWSGGSPNDQSTNVCITDGTSGVTLDMNASVADLQLASGNLLTVGGGNSLSIYGSQLINAGQITIQASSSYSGANAYLNFDNGLETTLSGGGTVTLVSDIATAHLSLANNGAGTILYNYDTIQGVGNIDNIYSQFHNYGTINSNSSDSFNNNMIFADGTVVNTGLMEATNAGTLEIDSTTVNNTGGIIWANGANAWVILDNGTTIQGGTLTNNGGSYLGTGSGSATLVGSPDFSNPVTINGTFTVQDTTTLNLSGVVVNNGNIMVTEGVAGGLNGNAVLNILPAGAVISGGTVTLWSDNAGTASISLNNNGAGAYLNNSSTIQGVGVIDNTNALLDNYGTINANSTGGPPVNYLTLYKGTVANLGGLIEATASDGGLINEGSMTLTGNTGGTQGVTLDGGLINEGSMTLTGNTGGTQGVTLDGGLVNEGSLTLTGNTGGSQTITLSGNLANSGSLTLSGVTGLSGTGTITVGGNLDNSGSLTLSTSQTINVSGNFDQTAGSTQVNGTLSAVLTHIMGGTLGGAGTINGPVKVGGGTIIAGAPGVPGTLTIIGKFVQDAGGTMIIDITGANSFGAIDVTGMASLGGTLDINFLDGFTPQPGEDFPFLSYGSLDPANDDFSNIDFTDCQNCELPVFGQGGVVFEPVGPGGQATPEPSGLILLGTALLGTASLLQRRTGKPRRRETN